MIVIDSLRIYLLAGLLLHKLIWQLKRGKQAPHASAPTKRTSLKLVKAVKIAILVGILVQTIIPTVLPLSSDPQGLRIAGVVLYTAGLMLAILGRIQLGENWLDIESAAVKKTQAVVSNGIYRYLRHPIYVGDLMLLIGLELALNSWGVLLVLLLIPIVLRQAIAEERMLRRSLPGYDLYCRRSWRFIPFLA